LLAGGTPDNATQKRIATLLEGINECQAGMPAALKRIQATLAARSTKTGADTSKPDTTNRDFRQIVGAPANYPRRAINRGIEGEVLVQFTISKTGDVDEIEIVSADPEGWFERAVTEAVSKYKFQPRIKNGQPVEAKGVQRKIVFKLR
jgi:TonB family protein